MLPFPSTLVPSLLPHPLSPSQVKLGKFLKSSSLPDLSISPILSVGFPPAKLNFTPTTRVTELLKSGEVVEVRWSFSAAASASGGKRKDGGKAERGTKDSWAEGGAVPPL